MQQVRDMTKSNYLFTISSCRWVREGGGKVAAVPIGSCGVLCGYNIVIIRSFPRHGAWAETIPNKFTTWVIGLK